MPIGIEAYFRHVRRKREGRKGGAKRIGYRTGKNSLDKNKGVAQRKRYGNKGERTGTNCDARCMSRAIGQEGKVY